MNILNLINILAFLIFALQWAYLILLALAAIKPHDINHPLSRRPVTCFGILIPAHDEENVIGETVQRLHSLNYPPDLYHVFIVADHCTDGTAACGRSAGALVFERNEGPRTGKGAALSWLFQKIFLKYPFDAAVIFDADTRVDKNFLRFMDLHLRNGGKVIQGRHIISNHHCGWFPALIWSMFLIDNRFQNLGRANINLSAKHMGDSICIRTDLLREVGWGQGLADDYELRHELLLRGIRIEYEPCAIGYGEAPLTWQQAQKQRARWIQGAMNCSRRNVFKLFVEGFKRRDLALLDGACQAFFASFSTLTIFGGLAILITALVNFFMSEVFSWSVIYAYFFMIIVLVAYPFLGLILEKAPLRAYLAISMGPLFVLWRTWLALQVRLSGSPGSWVRTQHGIHR